jgi:glutathione peroxidase
LTPQYAGLRTLHNDNADRGFVVLAFPCNQFAGQEPGTDAEILDFATSKFQVNFPMFSKTEVNGDDACDLYQWLKAEHAGQGALSDITWNFEKFLIDRSGNVVARFGPKVTPEEIAPQLEQYLVE